LIVADTGALLALIDADDRHHDPLRRLFGSAPASWIVPWAVLPEVDYLLARHLGPKVELAFLEDLAEGASAAAATPRPRWDAWTAWSWRSPNAFAPRRSPPSICGTSRR
jgi:predicted nucleic acid-binding protein